MIQSLLQYYYARYGLADVLFSRLSIRNPDEAHDKLDAVSDSELTDAFEARIRELLREIRVHFPEPDYPAKATVNGRLVRNPDGSTGEQVAENGFYVRPHVLLGDGGLNGRNGLINKPLPGKKLLQRYYPPATKLSIGKASASNVKKDRLFSLACTVASLTPLKAARRSGPSDRAAVIPDLPLPELITYLDLFEDVLPALPAPTQARTNEDGKPYLDQNWGTFPDPPPSWTFGTLGVVAGIGSWARENGFFEDAKPVLHSLATGRVYVIDTSGDNRVETAGSHVVRLSRDGTLRRVLDDTWQITTEANQEDLHRLLRRWLLRFTTPYFRDFLAMRATYPPSFRSLFDAYFMQAHDPSLIRSARAAGQHINSQAYHAAGGSGDTRRTNKQTILSSLESMLYDCDSGAELIARVSVQVGRLTGRDFPPEAQTFFDQTTAGELTLKEARNLLVAYMRLRKQQKAAPAESPPDEDTEEATPAASAEPAASGSESSFDPDSEIPNL